MESYDIWQKVFQNVKENALVYLTSPQIQKKYKNPETAINIRVDDLNGLVNACVTRIDANTYDICIFAGLIAALEQECSKVLQEFPQLFEKVDRASSKKLGMAHSALLYLWLDFICCHEWAHAICGHLDFDRRVAEWNELEIDGSPQGLLEEYVSQHIEAEADSFAAKFSLARFSTYWRGLSDDLYGKLDGEAAFRDYIMAMLLLFRFFESTHKDSKAKKNTHPAPFDRAFVALSFIQAEYANIPGLPKISMGEDSDHFALTVVDFYVQILKINPTQYLIRSVQAAQFMERVGKTLEVLEIKKYRLFK